MGAYFYTFPTDEESLAVQSSLRASFGSSVRFKGVNIPIAIPGGVGLEVDTDDSMAQSDIDSNVTDTTSKYTVSTPLSTPDTQGTPSGFSWGPNMGAFLNSIGDAVRNWFNNLTFPKDCQSIKDLIGIDVCKDLLIILFVILGIFVAILFFTSFSKGLGGGVAARV